MKRSSTEEGEVRAQEPPAPWRRLELHGVTHAYRREGEDQSFTLGPVDLTVTPGEILFITRGNGSGRQASERAVGRRWPDGGKSTWRTESETRGARFEIRRRKREGLHLGHCQFGRVQAEYK